MMRSTRFLAALLVGLIWASAVYAGTCGGTCFWIGGNGTINGTSDDGHWSSTTGGAACASPCVPGGTDNLTFDGSSGGGTATWAMNLTTTGTLTCSNYTGTLDNSVNNNTLSFGAFTCSGAATKTVKFGAATWNITGTTGTVWDTSTSGNLTMTGFTTSTVHFTGNPTGTRTITIANKTTYPTFSMEGTGEIRYGIVLTHTGATLNGLAFPNSPAQISITSAVTLTITNTVAWAGSASGLLFLSAGTAGSNATLHLSGSSPTCSWAHVNDFTVNTNLLTCNNSFTTSNQNVGVTINPPVLTNTGYACIGC